MEHNLFKPKTLEEAMHSVVGDCNGIPMAERWEKETPLFAERILAHVDNRPGFTICDYGCGCGRMAKEVLRQNKNVTVIGLDASSDELALAKEYVNDSRFIPVLPYELNQKVDLVYSIYCLQHCPAIDLREVLQRIHTFLKDDGVFIYCSSDYRMAIRFDGQGFFDDRFLGVNIREEIKRLFDYQWKLFHFESDGSSRTIDCTDPVVRQIIENVNNTPGGIPHPAEVYRKKKIYGYLFNGGLEKPVCDGDGDTKPSICPDCSPSPKKLILRNRLSPGDVLVMSAAIRALHVNHPGKFITDVDTPCNEIFQHNPRITQLNGNGQVIDMHYPLISDHQLRGFNQPGAGVSGRHFSDGHRKYLEEVLGIEIPRAGLIPDIFLSQDEKLWPSPVFNVHGYEGKYWVINAGSKSDFTLKQYHRWQEVIDRWTDKFTNNLTGRFIHPVRFVQIGQLEHKHPALEGAIDMRGKTNIRELFRLINQAEGVLTCISFPMHIAAALEKPCVVVAGGRESTRWELYPNQRFLYTNGALDCCLYDGCWKSKIEDCSHRLSSGPSDGALGPQPYSEFPLCLELIRPEDIVRAMDLYYLGGVLKMEDPAHV